MHFIVQFFLKQKEDVRKFSGSSFLCVKKAPLSSDAIRRINKSMYCRNARKQIYYMEANILEGISVKRILSYLKIYQWQMLFGFIVKVAAAVAELFMPWILAHILDDIIPEVKQTEQIAPLVYWGFLMFLLALGVRMFNVFANRKAAEVSKNAIERLRYDLFQKIMTLSGRQTDDIGIPSLISRMTSDSYNVHHAINMMQRMGVRAPMIIIGGLFITVALEPVLTLVLAATLPFIAFIVYFISKKGIPLYGKVQQAADVMVRTVREDVAGIRVIKALSKAEYEKKRFKKANEAVAERELAASGVMAASGPLLNLCLNLGLTAVIAVGAFRVNAGVSEPGKIVAFLTYFTMILNAVISINRIFVVISKASASAVRMDAILSAENDLPVDISQGTEEAGVEQEGTFQPDTDNQTIPAKVEFKDVSFGYKAGEDKYCLRHISFTLYAGETLGIIGATGSGKTTIFNLLMRFYDVDEGEIRVDGKNIKNYGLHELREKFGVAFQNDVLFADTIEENIRFGRELPKERLETAAEQAKAFEFIMEKDGGFSHMAAIKGANFSGGQKQRLLVARALAGKPELLLLDDASSALDYKTDAYIRKQIKEQYAGTTMITIAQRISSVMQCTKILVLEDGEIIGLGSHEDLLRQCEVYQEIAESQLGLHLTA